MYALWIEVAAVFLGAVVSATALRGRRRAVVLGLGLVAAGMMIPVHLSDVRQAQTIAGLQAQVARQAETITGLQAQGVQQTKTIAGLQAQAIPARERKSLEAARSLALMSAGEGL